MTSVSNAAVGAFLAGNAAAKARHGMNEAIARLSTGVRAMYGGDAGGASVGHVLRADGRGALMAARNVEDGISFLQAGESALLELAALNTRLRELAVQKLNADFLDDNQDGAIDAEETQIVAAAGKIDNSTLNSVSVLTAAIGFTIDMDGNLSTVGAAAGIALAAGVGNTKTQGGKIAKALGSMAAGISALKGHQGTLYALSANAEAAAARVTDTDFARSSADLAKFSIMNQSAMAMVAQANQASAAVLAVLQ